MFEEKTSKPSIVLIHGIWADGLCFGKVILKIQAEGYEVIAASMGLATNEADLDRSGLCEDVLIRD